MYTLNRKNNYGTPFFYPLIHLSFVYSKCKIIIYFNSDILFYKTIFHMAYLLSSSKLIYKKKIMVAGRRGDLFWKNFTNRKDHNLLWNKSKLHSGSGIDYFIFSEYLFSQNDKNILSEIVIGRVRYDNIILSLALKNKMNIVVDATYYIKAIHLSVSDDEKNQLTKVYF